MEEDRDAPTAASAVEIGDLKSAEEIGRRKPEVSNEGEAARSAAEFGHKKAAEEKKRMVTKWMVKGSKEDKRRPNFSDSPTVVVAGKSHTWPLSTREKAFHYVTPPHSRRPMSSSGDRSMAHKFFSRILSASTKLLDLISSPLVSSSHIGNLREHLKHVKLSLYNVEIEMTRGDSIHLFLKELKDLIAEIEDTVDEYLYVLLQTRVEKRNSAALASHMRKKMDDNEENMPDINFFIPYEMSERIKMMRRKFIVSYVIWMPRSKTRNYSKLLQQFREYKLLRAHVSEQATTAKASLEMKEAVKDEADDELVVSSAKKAFHKIVDTYGSTSSGITLNRAEEIKDKMSKSLDLTCQSKDDRKRLLGGCIDDRPPDIQIYGRDIDKEKVMNLLLSNRRCNLLSYEHGQRILNNLCVIPIIGVAGVGKTTLAKLLYNDAAVCDHFDARGWVNVSNDATYGSLVKAVTSSITGKSCYGNTLDHLQAILHGELIGKRLLLVLDDVKSHNSFPWKSILSILSSVMLGKIIVTSQDKLVDRTECGSTPYYLSRLPLDISWDLFKQRAFNGQNPEPQHKLVEIGMMILSKCNRLPLNVKILGSLLNFRIDKKIWADVFESEIWESETLPALVLSYNLLPRHLKPCFLYCSMFPRGYKFDKYELVRLWMAQDYIEPKGNKRMEDVGCEYFCELERMSFFEKSWDGTFAMHDLLYELAKSMSISQQEYCAVEDSDSWDVDGGVRQLYVAGGYQRNKSLLTMKPLALKSLLYQISDGRIPKSLLTSSSMKRLWTLQLKCHEDYTIIQEATHGIDLDEATLSSLHYGELIHLRYLQICDKYIESLSTSICKLYHLQTLILDNCSNLRELPSEIGNLLNMRYLGLSKVNISVLPESVCKLFNLQSLIVDYCRNLVELPTHIGDLKSLHNLGLSGTNITGLPESICWSSKVEILKMNNCTDFEELPSNIGYLKSLQEIEVTGARVARLPDSVCFLFKLWKLDMAGSDLLELPSSIGHLLSLNYLGLSHTNIDFLPDSLCQLLNLHALKLNGCTNLSHLPSGIGALTSLDHLLLSDTDIRELPESLCQLSNLQTLKLDGCIRCHCLPEHIGDLINLGHLNLSDTDISELPASFCELSNLEILELNGCYRLFQLPDNFGDLSNLCKLEITETEIRELPKSFCQLSNLRKLKLNGNKNLEEIPDSMKNLTNLTHVELCEVGIKKLPEHIGKLSKLVKLSFQSKYKPTVGFK